MSDQRRSGTGWMYAVLGLLALAAAIYLAFSGGAPDRSHTPATASASVDSRESKAPPRPSPAEPAAPTPTGTPDSEGLELEAATAVAEPKEESGPGTLRLTARLLPSGGASRQSLRAQVGVARISDEDRREFLAWREGGGEGAGPEDELDLANVAEWISAPVEWNEDGAAILGPLEVPEAPVYQILAWESDYRHYLERVVTPDPLPKDGLVDAGDLDVRLPTGLVVRLTNNPMELPHYLANLDRIVSLETTEEDSRVAPLLEAASKDLFDTLQGDLMYLMTADEEIELVPLYPDPAVRIRLSTLEGLQANPIEVHLERGVVRTVEVDLSKLFPGEVLDVFDLHGRVTLGKGGEPMEGVVIERVDAPIKTVQTTNRDGEFQFTDLPKSRVSYFEATISQPEGGRPTTVSTLYFNYDPSLNADDVADGEATAEIIAPPFRWLVLELPPDLLRSLQSQSTERYYPVYVLERYIQEIDTWRAVGAQEFLPEPDAMAVSITSPGTYRIVTATSPVEVFPSELAVIGEEDVEVRVGLSLSSAPAPRRVRVELSPPASGSSVIVGGNYGSLPPLRAETDRDGGLTLESVNVAEISLAITFPNGKSTDLDVALEQLPSDGVIRVEW